MYWFIGKAPWFFPFPLSIITLVSNYAIAVLLNEVTTGYEYVSAIFFILNFVFVYYMVVGFVIFHWTTPTTVKQKILGFMDGYVSIIHCISGMVMTIVILSTNNNDHYSNLPANIKGYDLFWTYCLSNIILMFNSAGVGNAGGITALGVLPGMVASITGVAYLGSVLTVVNNGIKTPKKRMRSKTSSYNQKHAHHQKKNRGPRKSKIISEYDYD